MCLVSCAYALRVVLRVGENCGCLEVVVSVFSYGMSRKFFNILVSLRRQCN